MGVKRLAVAVSLLWIVNGLRPESAYAQDPLVLAAIATGAYLGTVVIGAALYRETRGPFEFAPDHASPPRKRHRDGLRLGPKCPQTSASVTLLCW